MSLRRNTVGILVGCCFTLASLVGVGLFPESAVGASTTERPPLTASKPMRVANLMSALVQTAAIVEGTVVSVESEYTAETGPWTRYELSDVVAHRGRAGASLSFVQVGGAFPDGRMLIPSSIPRLERAQRYVLFLRNTGWNLSPIVGNYAFRVDTVDGEQVLVGEDGGVATGVSDSGVTFSEPLFSRGDLSGEPPARLERSVPHSAMSVTALLEGIDSGAELNNLAAVGTFYTEPFTRVLKRKFAPAAPATGMLDENPMNEEVRQ